MGKIVEMTITKGKTVRAADREEWIKLEFSLKALVDDQNDMEAAKAHLEGLLDGWLSSSLSASSAKPSAEAQTLDSIQNVFPAELRKLLTFEQNNEHITIRPQGFLGAENFSKIIKIVRGAGGYYVSSGKESHFRIPKKQSEETRDGSSIRSEK